MQAVPGTSLAPWSLRPHSPDMTHSTKKRPKNRVVSKVGLGLGLGGGFDKECNSAQERVLLVRGGEEKGRHRVKGIFRMVCP